jgi:hypothetical protein
MLNEFVLFTCIYSGGRPLTVHLHPYLGDIDEHFWGRNILRAPSEPDLVNEHMVMWHLYTVIDGGWCYIRISRWWQGG